MAQKMGAIEALLKSMYMQQNPHLSEEEVDDKMREALHNDNIPTPRSSTSTYAYSSKDGKIHVRNKDDPQDEQDDDLQYDQDDDDLQYDQDDDDLQYDQDDNDLQYDNIQDDDSHEPQHNEYDKDRR
ncbi:pheromone-processing carboxypeptidase KEX1-like [Lathyrus oleraceus]|uniref:pheromone-processing carboxypeptidase KEX1-like n=1 Tax=Pisum sativum TaxID=3888 RepID=UPI0021D1C2C1|nr:pheromone-processing carboxypeptidase KEX1-like [Pisum sativum]